MWTIGGIRVVVSKLPANKDSIYAELNPLGTDKSIIHHFGTKSRKLHLSGYFVGDDTLEGIERIIESGLAVPISGSNFYTTGYIRGFEHELLDVVAQTFDPYHACDDNTYSFKLEVVEQK